MRRRKHKYLIIILILLFISVGFAYLTSTLDIVGIGHLRKATWKIYFDNVNIVEGENLSSNPPTTTNHNTTSVSYTVNLTKPGDTYKFYIDIVNNGTIDAMVSLIDENTILTSDQSKYASYSISYIDGSPIEANNFLGRHSKETLQVIIKYKKDVTSSDLPTQSMNLSFNLRLTYKQAKNADNRRGESTIITDLSGNNNHGTLYGGRVNADGSVYLDGVDDYINAGLENYDFGDSASLVIKVKLLSLKNTHMEFFGNWYNSGFGIKAAPEHYFRTAYFLLNDVEINRNANGPDVDTDLWYTLTSTYDGSSIKFYINGNLYATTNNISGNIKTTSDPFYIGCSPGANGTFRHFTNIIVSDALIFDRALTAEEIASDYATTVNPTNTSDMLLRYQFSNNTVKDLSGNGNNGTMYGNPQNNNDGTLRLDGVDDYIDCGLDNYDFGSTISLIARFQMKGYANQYGDYGIIENILTTGSTKGYALYLRQGNIGSALIQPAPTRYRSKIHPELDKWYTAVTTYDGEKIKLYIDGKETPLENTNDTYTVQATGNIPLAGKYIIGVYPPSLPIGPFSNMTISDILIFDRTVTKDEVINDYSKIISPSNREDLLVYYHFG